MEKEALLKLSFEPEPLRTLSPNDHVRMLVELLRPSGPELARRWLAALMVVPEGERAAVVESVEARIVSMYAPTGAVGAVDGARAAVEIEPKRGHKKPGKKAKRA